MKVEAFLTGANVVAFEKNNKKYGMTFAWGMQSDYDKILFLIGSQSETGKQISVGDIVGVSALAEDQIQIAKLFGTNHCSQTNKFADDKMFEVNETAILIKEAKTMMKIRVKKIMDLENSNDLLIYGEVLEAQENDKKFVMSESVWQA